MCDQKKLEQLFIEAYARVSKLPEELLTYIHRNVLISMIGASTRIENAVLTDQEIDWIDTVLTADGKTTAFLNNKNLVENKLSKDKERSIEEVAGCRSMLMLIYAQHNDLFPLTETAIRGLHYELMQYYPRASHYLGKYKTVTNSVVETNKVTGELRSVFETAAAGPITETAMADLVNWYNDAMTHENNSLAVVCEFVYRFLAIHPFQDGNGRVGRGLFLLGLLHSNNIAIKTIAPFIAFDREIEVARAEYYFVLNKCSNGKFNLDPSSYNIKYFVDFMVKVLTKSIKKIDYYIGKYESVQALSPSAAKVLHCFREYPEIRLTTRDIITKTNLPRRTVVNSLNSLLKYNLIQRYGKGRGVRYQMTF